MFGSFLPPPTSSCLLEGADLIYVFCVCLRIVVSNTYCIVFRSVFLRLLLTVSLDCHFFIGPSVFSNVYLPVSLDCHFLIGPMVFSNVYLVYPMLTVSLDCHFFYCPFGILECLFIIISCIIIIHYFIFSCSSL